MASVTKQFLSASTEGRQIGIGTAATLLHTADATLKDEVWGYCHNRDAVDRVLTLRVGGTAFADLRSILIPAKTTISVVVGEVLSGGLALEALAPGVDQLNFSGFVNRIPAFSGLDKQFLSQGANGAQIGLDATLKTVHTAHATRKDEVWLYCHNIDSAARDLTLRVGGSTAADERVINIPAESSILIIPGEVYTGGVVLEAAAPASNQLNISGFVNRLP